MGKKSGDFGVKRRLNVADGFFTLCCAVPLSVGFTLSVGVSALLKHNFILFYLFNSRSK